MSDQEKRKDVDNLLNQLFGEDQNVDFRPLNEVFNRRLAQLGITKNQALKILGIDHKTLSAILDGSSKKIDFVTILKMSDFLDIPYGELINKYIEVTKDVHSESIIQSKKRSFIVKNFDIASLKKIGFIDTVNDFDHIESKILTFFGYDSIFDHGRHKVKAAFSSGKRETNHLSLEFWYAAARQSLESTPNPHKYDRDALIEYFPRIRWHSMDVDRGLLTVAQALWKLGITLIYIPKYLSDMHIRGATLSYRNKPCIVLTDYTRFYASLWFALIHELFHVLYDWDEIKNESYHISGETASMNINEADADDFARKYLFSDEKMELVSPHIDEPRFVRSFAEQNHVHPSIVYTFYNWDQNDSKTYARYNRYMPRFDKLLERFKGREFKEYHPVAKVSTDRNIELSYL